MDSSMGIRTRIAGCTRCSVGHPGNRCGGCRHQESSEHSPPRAFLVSAVAGRSSRP